jgi:catechol 2,3-dioxygenase-like lactoylglutathione lyase family enzyme
MSKSPFFDHVGLVTQDLGRAVRFYQAALAPLGYELVSGDEAAGYAGFGPKDDARLWVNKADAVTARAHLAFRAPDRKAVDAFHAAALKAGGKDNGKPGIREAYAPGYFAAFVLDPDGNNVEAVILEK